MTLPFQQSNTLDILQKRVEQLDAQDDKLDKKAQENVQAVSIIFAFVGTFKLLDGTIEGLRALLLVFIFLIYGGIVVLSYYVIYPKSNWKSLVKADTTNLSRVMKQADANDYFESMFAGYTQVIKANSIVIATKEAINRFTTALMLIDLVLILFLAAS